MKMELKKYCKNCHYGRSYIGYNTQEYSWECYYYADEDRLDCIYPTSAKDTCKYFEPHKDFRAMKPPMEQLENPEWQLDP